MVNRPPPISKPQPFPVGVFSCLIAPVLACCWGFLRTSPAARIGRSWPFLAPASLPGTDPKSAKATRQPHTDQRVTRGRIKQLDCSIGCLRGHTLAPAIYRTCSLSETRIARLPVVLEKDIWVCWVLQALFTMPGRLQMAFKGGTSLSKVFGAIARFSESVAATSPSRTKSMRYVPTSPSMSLHSIFLARRSACCPRHVPSGRRRR